MKKTATLMAALAVAFAANAATVRMASETFVTNKITQAIAALPPAQTDLTPATNYTDSATNALAASLGTLRDGLTDGTITVQNANEAAQASFAFSASGAYLAEVADRLRDGNFNEHDTDAILADIAARATASQVTNIVRDLSLGGIWDSTLQVWWTPRMVNGSLTYHATTNVNLNAEN